MENKIILYYKYITLADTNQIYKWQKKLCEQLALKGRVIIAHEGINGTLGGSTAAINEYMYQMKQNEFFFDTDFKESAGGPEHFPRLSVKIRPEIVALSRKLKKPITETPGTYVTPQQAHEMMSQQRDDVVIFDVRNTYESRIGCFIGAVKADIQNFRDLPEYIDKNKELFRDKEVIMNCTGDVRCEMSSAYLKELHIAKKVYHIQGGIHRYAEAYPNGFFRGRNYVFDGRISLKVTDDILATCDFCPTAYDHYFNCINTQCNKQIIVCPACQQKERFTCSENCAQLVMSGQVKVRVQERTAIKQGE
ncbi:MAG: rhodanese-related sulfurtransferase [Candidatus Babeliaceae bacterium]